MQSSPGHVYRPVVGGPPRIRFEAIGEAWGLFAANMGTWIAATLIFFLIESVILGGLAFFLMADIFRQMMSGNPQPPVLGLLGVGVGLILTQALFMGGFLRMGIRQARGEPIGVGDLFSATDVYGKLLGYFVLAGLPGMLVNCIPGLALLAVPVSWVVTGALLFAAPLIVDRRLGTIEAITTSWEVVRPQLLMAILFAIVTQLIMGVGALACGVGLLFTIPWSILATVVLYRDFFIAQGAEGGMVEAGLATEPLIPPAPAAEPPPGV
jgi:hypothetical protein